MDVGRREFLKKIGYLSAGFVAAPGLIGACSKSKGAGANEMFFDISLAQWSLHKALFGGELDHLDFAATARNEFGIGAVEYVNQFFKDKAKDTSYLNEMNKRAADAGVKQVLIMCDGEGALGDPDSPKRQQAVENHYKWVEAAKHLGCHSIRVNAQSSGTYEEQMKLAADGLRKLTEFARGHGINVIVENHGGLSSNAQWLVGVMKLVDLPRCGTLPDFGNFCIRRDGESPYQGECVERYDYYQGVKELMPYAKGVSAKSFDFDEQGNETTIDYERMMKIVREAGYTGHVGIEYEGGNLSEYEGIKATKRLLERVGKKLAEG